MTRTLCRYAVCAADLSMSDKKISQLSDDQLIEGCERVYLFGRRCAAQLIRLLIEVEHRRLHLTTAHPSMFEFCVRRLQMSRGSAQRYSTAARLAVKFPQLVDQIESGDLH